MRYKRHGLQGPAPRRDCALPPPGLRRLLRQAPFAAVWDLCEHLHFNGNCLNVVAYIIARERSGHGPASLANFQIRRERQRETKRSTGQIVSVRGWLVHVDSLLTAILRGGTTTLAPGSLERTGAAVKGAAARPTRLEEEGRHGRRPTSNAASKEGAGGEGHGDPFKTLPFCL